MYHKLPLDIQHFTNTQAKNNTQKKIISLINSSKYWIYIKPKEQSLTLFNTNQTPILKSKISTAKNGLGQQKDSFKTPTGWHIIRAKIGQNHPPGAVFIARRWSKEIFSPQLQTQYPHRDWILTRILWLSGLEPGFNRLGDFDSMSRFIYIHGTADTHKLGQPLSHGCIRMNDHDLIKLFDIINPYTPVFISNLN